MSTSRKNTKDTNQTNLEIAQMGNEYNMAMLDKQIQEQWKMWQAENEYNSASAQRQRLEAAGLNPYLMMDGGNAGSASSMTAPAAQGAIVPTMQVPPQSGLQEFLAAIDGITQLAGGITNTLFTGTQIAGASVDNMVKKQTALADIQQRRALSQISQITAGNEKTRQNLNIAGQSISNEAAYQSLLGHAVDNLRAYTELQALPQQLQYSLAHLAADLKQKYLNHDLTRKQIEKEIQSISSLKLENQYAGETMDARVRTAEAQAASAEANQGANNMYQLAQDFLRHFVLDKSNSKPLMEQIKDAAGAAIRGDSIYSNPNISY